MTLESLILVRSMKVTSIQIALFMLPRFQTTLLKTHQQLQSARRNNRYKFVDIATFLFQAETVLKNAVAVCGNRQHKLLSHDEDDNLQPALGENVPGVRAVSSSWFAMHG